MPRVDYRLNAIVDAGALKGAHPGEMARAAAEGGATILQYRDKTGSTRQMIDNVRVIVMALAGTDVPLVVNDRVDVALAAGAAGVHLGREDMDPATARRLLGRAAIIGATVKTEADARRAADQPVDYACIGGVFETLSKTNLEPPVGLDGLARLRTLIRSVRPDLPVGAIAGIDLDRVPGVIAAGADGVAVISAVFSAPDPAGAARALIGEIDRALEARAP